MSSSAYATPQSKFHSYQNPYKTQSTDSIKTNSFNSSANRFSPSKDNSQPSLNQTKSEKKIFHDPPSAEKHFSGTLKHITQTNNEETLEFSSTLGRRERKISENQHKLVKGSSTNPETTITAIEGKKQIFVTPVESVAPLQIPQKNQHTQIQKEQPQGSQQSMGPNIPVHYEYINIFFNQNQLKPTRMNQNSNQLTWTRYLSLEFKNEELIKQLKIFKDKLNLAQNMIRYMEEERNQMEKFFIRQIDIIKAHHNQQISKLNNENQNKINEKNECINNLINKITSDAIDKFDQQIKNYLTRIQQQNILLTQDCNQKSDQLIKINGQLENLRQTVQRLQGREKSYKQSIKKMYDQLASVTSSLSFKNKNSYQVIIKAQLSQIGDIRQNSQLLNEENISLRDKISNLQRQLQNVYSQLSVADLKQKTEKNKLITEYGIQVTNKSNEIQVLKRKLCTLQDKYKLSANDIKAKDEFFRTHLVGRVDDAQMKNYINNLMSKYSQKFSLETHSHNECKQIIEELKKKIELYENSP